MKLQISQYSEKTPLALLLSEHKCAIPRVNSWLKLHKFYKEVMCQPVTGSSRHKSWYSAFSVKNCHHVHKQKL